MKRPALTGVVSVALLIAVITTSCTNAPEQNTVPASQPAAATTAATPAVSKPAPATGPTATALDPAAETAPIATAATGGTPGVPESTTGAPFAGQPLVSVFSDRFAGSGDCAVCHSLLIDSAGNDADEGFSRYEPHYDRIDRPSQVQIYEPIMLNSDGEVTYTLLRAAAYAKDNRLLPIGFDKVTAGEAFAVHGAAVEDETFSAGLDRITFQVDVQGYEGPFTVHAELLYQTLSYRFAQDLCQDEGAPVERMCDAYRAADHTPALVAAAERKVR